MTRYTFIYIYTILLFYIFSGHLFSCPSFDSWILGHRCSGGTPWQHLCSRQGCNASWSMKCAKVIKSEQVI